MSLEERLSSILFSYDVLFTYKQVAPESLFSIKDKYLYFPEISIIVPIRSLYSAEQEYLIYIEVETRHLTLKHYPCILSFKGNITCQFACDMSKYKNAWVLLEKN